MFKLPNGYEVDARQISKIYSERSFNAVVVRLLNGVELYLFERDDSLEKIHQQTCSLYRKELNRIMEQVVGANQFGD